MSPRTSSIPKALVPVAGRPFADWQLAWLAGQGVRRVVYSIGHLGDMIVEYVGDGRRWGLEAKFVSDHPGLLGTAGAIRHAADTGVLEEAFFVLYGDSYLTLDLASVEAAFHRSGQPALMTVLRNNGQWDISNVVYRGDRVVVYDKDLLVRPKEMVYIDYGLLVLTRSLIVQAVPAGGASDLSHMLRDLAATGRLAALEASERFYEVGSPQGLRELEAHIAGRG
jgi:NDP-sugar pyrophosphorylase family protein